MADDIPLIFAVMSENQLMRRVTPAAFVRTFQTLGVDLLLFSGVNGKSGRKMANITKTRRVLQNRRFIRFFREQNSASEIFSFAISRTCDSEAAFWTNLHR